MLRYGSAIWNYNAFDAPLANARRFRALGFDATSYTAKDFYTLGDADAAALAAFLRDSGNALTVHCLLPDPDHPEAIAEYQAAARWMCEWQARYGLMQGLTFDMWYDRARQMPLLAWTVALFRGSGTFIACEDFPLDAREAELLEEVARPGDAFGLLVDVGHMNLRMARAGEHTPEAFVRAFERLPLPVLELHLHDNLGEKDDHRWLGFGTLPLKAVVEGLKACRFDGIVTVEIVQRGWSLEEGLCHAQDTVRRFQAAWAAGEDR